MKIGGLLPAGDGQNATRGWLAAAPVGAAGDLAAGAAAVKGVMLSSAWDGRPSTAELAVAAAATLQGAAE